jgi:hypothetical protein
MRIEAPYCCSRVGVFGRIALAFGEASRAPLEFVV